MSTASLFYGGLVLFVALGPVQGGFGRGEAESIEPGAATPLDVVRSSMARVQGIVRSAPGDRVELRRTVETLFDFEAVSRRMLAQHWNDGSPEQQAEFVRLLTNLLERTFLDSIVKRFGGPTTFDGEVIDGVHAQVKSRVALDRGAEISIEYRLARTDARWAVYDVVYDGVSLVANYRSQFRALLRTSTFAQLLVRMRGDERDSRVPESAQDVGRLLMLFAAGTERAPR